MHALFSGVLLHLKLYVPAEMANVLDSLPFVGFN